MIQGKATERYQRTVGIDTLHKEIELVEHPLADRQPARVRRLVSIRHATQLPLLIRSSAGPAAYLGQGI